MTNFRVVIMGNMHLFQKAKEENTFGLILHFVTWSITKLGNYIESY